MKRERGSTIERVLDILDTVAASTKPLSATEINEVLNLPKATAHRLCAKLEARGYLLKRIDGKSYQPGNRLFDVAVGVLASSRFGATRHAILTELSEKVGETCNIAYPDGLYMAYSDRVETKAPLRLQFPIGMRVPLYCTASGKLYLSTLQKSRRKAVINKLKLAELDPSARKEIEKSFDRLINKLLHPPLASLRDDAAEGHRRGLLEALRHLFNLGDE